MLIGIIGESCTGKSTLADCLRESLSAKVYTGKDYLRLAKNEAMARKLFAKELEAAVAGENIVYVIAEKEHLQLLPEGALRILVTADLSLIEERFAARMRGVLPPPVKAMLEKKHGIFHGERCDFRIHNSEGIDDICNKILQLAQ